MSNFTKLECVALDILDKTSCLESFKLRFI